jgi:broad specificity phosphatase PhoE
VTTRIYLVRHGITVVGGEDRFAGEIDVPLSDTGREQARALGARLASEPIAAAYASPLERALETARLVAAPHGCEVIPRAELREISHGRWEQRTRAEVENLFPAEYERWESDPFTFAPEGGETGVAWWKSSRPTRKAASSSSPTRRRSGF